MSGKNVSSPAGISAKLRSFLKSNPHSHKLALKIFFSWRQLTYWIRVFPLPLGRSPYDSLGKRKELGGLIDHSRFPARQAGALNWSQDFKRFDSMESAKSYFFPISFSWPSPISVVETNITPSARKLVSTIIPGSPYSFSDYGSYLSEYRQSRFGITIKKGGWDCFRHIEILAAGAIPFMPDVQRCPDWAMFHYPKSAMAQVADALIRGEELPDQSWEEFKKWFEENLTSMAMATFILKRVRYQSQRIIFLDPGLASVPDYLSVMTYIGLKQKLNPQNVIAPLGSSSVYADWEGETANLHGLGFGYTKLLDSSMRSDAEVQVLDATEALDSLRVEDFVIVANVSRNRDFANQVNSLRRDPDSTLFIWGDDRSPDRAQIRWLKSLSGFKAIREFYPSPDLLVH